MIARFLCLLDLHQPVVTIMGFHKDGRYYSAQGFCARCNKPYQWDH